jgi:hypothetical protein
MGCSMIQQRDHERRAFTRAYGALLFAPDLDGAVRTEIGLIRVGHHWPGVQPPQSRLQSLRAPDDPSNRQILAGGDARIEDVLPSHLLTLHDLTIRLRARQNFTVLGRRPEQPGRK